MLAFARCAALLCCSCSVSDVRRAAAGPERASRAGRGRAPCRVSASAEQEGEQGSGRPLRSVGEVDAVLGALQGVSKSSGRDVASGGRNLVLGLQDTDEESWRVLDQKVNQYPCVREFKCIGSGGEDFVASMMAAAQGVTGLALRREEVVVRASKTGKYSAVNLYLEVGSGEEVMAIFSALQKDARLRFFL